MEEQQNKTSEEQGKTIVAEKFKKLANRLERFGQKIDVFFVRWQQSYKNLIKRPRKLYNRLVRRSVYRVKRIIKKLRREKIFSFVVVTALTTFIAVPILLFFLFDKHKTAVQPFKVRTVAVNGVSFDMIFVQGGTFTMGCVPSRDGDNCRDNERPYFTAHVEDFYFSKFPVTQALWKAVMGRNPSTIVGDDLPVVNVSWYDCQNFIERLNNLTGMRFRLPTEAEWEFAARGGTKGNGYKFSGSNTLDEVAWYSGNTQNKEVRLQPVGTKKPNQLGIHDMTGNIWEWVNDWYGEYTPESKIDPQGPETGTYRVNRGGGWSSQENVCRISSRNYTVPSLRYDNLGFGLALHFEH